MPRRRLIRITAVAATLAALLTLALPGQASAGAVPDGWQSYDWYHYGDIDKGWVSGEVYGVEVYSDTTYQTKYYYGRAKARIEWGAKRILVYYVRLYGKRSDGTYVRLASNETDTYSSYGAVSVRTPGAYTSKAPCDLRVKMSLAIRWSDNTVGGRTGWSDFFNNNANPNCA